MKPSRYSVSRFVFRATTLLGIVGPITAQIVLVDTGNNDSWRGLSITAPDSNSNIWNSVWSGDYYSDLLDTTGEASGISFGFVKAVGTDSFNGPAGATSSATLTSDVLNTDVDAVALGPLGGALAGAFDYYVDSVVSIQGLDSSLTYTIELFGSHKFNADATTVYTLYTENPTDVANSGGADVLEMVSLNVHQPGSPWLHNRNSIAIATVSGQSGFYLGFTGSGGNPGYLNAMSITVDSLTTIPEPKTFGLWVGVVSTLFLRRKRGT